MLSQSNKILELKGVSAGYGDNIVLSDINLSINEGDFVAITGPNGGGKTTLLRIILGLIKPLSGDVLYFNGNDTVDALKFGYLPQKNSIDSMFPITVHEVVSSGLLLNKSGKFRWKTPKGEDELIEHVLNLVGMSDYKYEPIGNLSGGQLQRVLLGRAIISKPKVLVLDEPLSYLDKNFEKELYSLMDTIAKDSTIILVSHEMTYISQMANRHIIVDRSIHDCHATHHFVRTECD